MGWIDYDNKRHGNCGGGGLHTNAHTDNEVTATSLGISIADGVRRYVASLSDGAVVSRASCFEWFMGERPDIETIAPAALNSFKMSITRGLNNLCGKKVLHLISGGGTGNGPLVYRKGQRLETDSMNYGGINLGTLENLVSEGYSKTEVCATLLISEATLMRRRRTHKEVQAAWDRGIERFQRREQREEGLALVAESGRELLPVERLQQATRAAAVELAYVETWGEHSPKSTEVLRMVVEAGKS